MKTTTEYVQKNMNKFLDTYEIFEKVALNRRFSKKESIALYNIYLNRSD